VNEELRALTTVMVGETKYLVVKVEDPELRRSLVD
jgi:hypothetical protein